MTFAEKLDLLMNVTNTSNSMLARSISMDPSFISRLRRGTRTPARNVNYILAMAEYFNRSCHAEYQKAALREAMKSSFINQPQETCDMVELLNKWLKEEDKASTDSINEFLNDLGHFQFKKTIRQQLLILTNRIAEQSPRLKSIMEPGANKKWC